MVDFYQIRSPLSQITEERMHRFINALSDALGEKLEKVSLVSSSRPATATSSRAARAIPWPPPWRFSVS